eukprot:11121988-Ditylum_brightwellii.AAC.1
MREQYNRIDVMAIEVICSCLVGDDVARDGFIESIESNEDFACDVIIFLNTIQETVQYHTKINLNMMTLRDTKPRSDDNDGLINDMDKKTKMTAYVILGEETGCNYEQIRKKLNGTSKAKLPSKCIIDQIQSIEVEMMAIDPDTSANDDSEDESVMDAHIAGGYSSYLKIMVEKHKQYNNDIKDIEDIIVMTSFYGTEHMKLKKQILGNEEMSIL